MRKPSPSLEFPQIVALVPLKAHSERVTGKNTRNFCGKPLYFWILEALLRARHVQKIVIDTDSDEIAAQAQAQFDIQILERPAYLLGDHIVADDLITYDIEQIRGADHFLQTHATNPLLRSATIDEAVESFFSQQECDSLFSVTEVRARYFFPDGSPVQHNPAKLIPTQELDPLYEENSCLYIFSRASFQRRGNRLGENPMMFPMDALEAVDIDEELDFKFAEVLMRERLAGSEP